MESSLRLSWSAFLWQIRSRRYRSGTVPQPMSMCMIRMEILWPLSLLLRGTVQFLNNVLPPLHRTLKETGTAYQAVCHSLDRLSKNKGVNMSKSSNVWSAVSATLIATVCIAQVADPPSIVCPGRWVSGGLSMNRYWVPAFVCPDGTDCAYGVFIDGEGNETGRGYCVPSDA